MKYTTEYCRNNKVAIQVNSEEELKKLYTYFPNYKYYEKYSEINKCYIFNNSVQSQNIDKMWFSYNKDYQLITFKEFMKNQTKRLEEFTDKDVIHCPTEELANKICKLLHDNGFKWCSDKPYLNNNNWKPYQKDTCYWIIKGEYASMGYYQKKDYIIYKAEDILALYETDNLEEQIMKETRKIIGYKCPISLFNGEVEKGTLFVKLSDTMYEAQSPIKEVRTMKFLPKEIVETWIAVLEDEFKVGDWVKFTSDKDDTIYISQIEIWSPHSFCYLKNGTKPFKGLLKKATQAEIDSLFNKTLTLSNGKEVIVNKGIIKANNEIVSLESWKNLLITGKKVNSYDVELTDATFKIGCWSGVKLADLELIIKTAEEQIELLK